MIDIILWWTGLGLDRLLLPGQARCRRREVGYHRLLVDDNRRLQRP